MNTPKRVWIGTSWKMNKTLDEARIFANALLEVHELPAAIQCFVIPPITAAREVKSILKGTAVKVGAQNMHWEDHGAWTGEISPIMLKDCDLDIVEIGHSERRLHFGETDEMVGKKIAAAARHAITPLICVGETCAERVAGETARILEKQVTAALSLLDVSKAQPELIFAYEPVWAIGDGGTPATADYADAQHAHIKSVAREILGLSVTCIYGGSVNSTNCGDLISCPNIDGLFIGRSAWSAAGYLEILRACADSLVGVRR